MRLSRKLLVVTVLTAAGFGGGPAWGLCSAPTRFDGTWRGNDGGIYQMREVGGRVTWLGRSGDGGQTFTNRFDGRRNGNVVTGDWLDVPPGRIRSRGTLTLRLDRGLITRVSATGGFGGSRWSKPCDDVVLNPVNE
jgi:hypothetical protein